MDSSRIHNTTLRVAPPRVGLLPRLLLAYLLPTLTLFAVFGLLTVRVTGQRLERALGQRLTAIAQAAATQVTPEAVEFLGPGDDDSRTALRLRRKLRQLKSRTAVARIFILDHQLTSRADTDQRIHIGDRHYNAEADRSELEQVFRGKATSSVLFQGVDGRYYKTGYAPIGPGKRVVAALGVEGSAEFFKDLGRLRSYLFLAGAVIAALIVLVTVLVARRITRPLRSLAREARRIGAGKLERSIPVTSRDEVGLLASTMNEMRKGLHHRDQQMQMMLSGIAHEVRNPLGGIALFAGLLREELERSPELLELVRRIERELEHLKNVVGEFLDFARRSPPHPQDLDLAALADDVAQVLQADAGSGGVELHLDLQQSRAQADPEQIRRLLINLGRNALQATGPGGRVTLSCGNDGAGRPFLEVSDTGKGIPDEIREEIFTPFFTTREKGTGLGLALSKKIIDQHGGRLDLDSGSSGTRIRVTLHSTPDQAEDQQSPAARAEDG